MTSRGTLKACKEVPALRAKEAKPWKYSPLKLPFPPGQKFLSNGLYPRNMCSLFISN